MTEKEIFSQIWRSPRSVFKHLNDTGHGKYVMGLLAAGGIGRAIDRAALRGLGDDMPLLAVLGIAVFAGGFFGWIGYYIYAALLSWTGKWLNSKGDTTSLVRMLAYALIPQIAALVLLILRIVLFGNGMFQSDIDFLGDSVPMNILFYGTGVVEIVLGIWTVVLLVIGISEVQKLTIAKAILNMLLPIFVVFLPLSVILIWINMSA